ncbi:hypothetical protein V5O48_017185, partial [Marasmius crinis-equi]
MQSPSAGPSTISTPETPLGGSGRFNFRVTSPSSTITSRYASLNYEPLSPYSPATVGPSRKPCKRRVDQNGEPVSTPKAKKLKLMEGCESEEEEVKKKLAMFFEFLQDKLHWTYGELLYHTTYKRWASKKEKTKRKEDNAQGKGKGKADSETLKHAQVIAHFFRASGKFSPGQILQNWLLHPTGARTFKEEGQLYSRTVPYYKNRGVRQVLTSFAVQIVANKLVEEAELAID